MWTYRGAIIKHLKLHSLFVYFMKNKSDEKLKEFLVDFENQTSKKVKVTVVSMKQE